MILTDREIDIAMRLRSIIVDPSPGPEALSSTSLDLSLDRRAQTWKSTSMAGVEQQVICPWKPGYSYSSVVAEFVEDMTMPDTGYILEPKQFLLGWTRERVELPVQSRIAARVEGKSSLARLGIGIHVTAPTIHAGFKGQIQLEIFNHGTLRIRLIPGAKICQLVFETTTGTPEKGYTGIFLGQGSATQQP